MLAVAAVPKMAAAYETPAAVKVFGFGRSRASDRLAPMTLLDGLALREATSEDLPAIGSLRESVGWTAPGWALRAVIGVPHARCVVVDDGARTVAVGSGIAYGPLGFVGNMVVDEAHRRRGLGSAVLDAVTEFLDRAGCRRIELNATDQGRPLYERHGFASIGTSATTRIPRTATLAPDPTTAVRQASPIDLDSLAEYDHPRFGGDRRMILAALLGDPSVRVVVADRDKVTEGYSCIQQDPPRIGPMLADDPRVAETLLVEAFARHPATDALRLNLPPNNKPGADWLRGLGLEVEPWDGRMARGPQVPRRDDTVYGMAFGALG
jgi:ribosomal protein S18 acetylase RimI-like enzyme